MTPIFSPQLKASIARRIKGTFDAVAKWSGYDAARPSRTTKQANRLGSNPNTARGNYERTQMMWNGEWLVKNVPFATNYVLKRLMYCSGMIHYTPNTGDTGLDEELASYLAEDAFLHGGIDCSFFDAYSRTADVEQPTRGDALLIWYRDDTRLRLMEAGADQIGELYTFTSPRDNLVTGLSYYAGKWFLPNGQTAGYKVYDRGHNETYGSPKAYDATDCIYFQDNIFRATRGYTKFHSAILMLTKGDALFNHGIDSAARQAKTAAVVFNNSGQADALTYETLYGDESQGIGQGVYVERIGNGPITEFKFTGDSYEVMKAESPGAALIEGCKHADEHASLGLGFPYSFLVNARDIGGAPSRFEINIASNEITRLRERVHRPRLNLISYVFIMDAVARKKFPAKPFIDRGEWHFPNLPVADAFRDSMDDIKSVRAGQDSNTRVVGRYGTTFTAIISDKKREAIEAAKAVQDANDELQKEGYQPTITANDILQTTENPIALPPGQQHQGNPPGDPSKKLVAPNVTTKLSAYIGDVKAGDLPESVQECIRNVFGSNGETPDLHVIKYMMTPQELEPMADVHNLESANEKAHRMTRKDAAAVVHSDTEKHILTLNNKIVDGHHHLAKALHGKVTKSLPVVDLTPARFQSESVARFAADFDESKHPRDNKGEFSRIAYYGKNAALRRLKDVPVDLISERKKEIEKTSGEEYEIRKVRVNEIKPSQSGEDYINGSSKETAKQLRHPDAHYREEDALPVEVDKQGNIVDGNHRHAAAVMNGDSHIAAFVPKSSRIGKIIEQESIARLESFDPTKHPRGGKGTHEGGKFVSESGTPENKKADFKSYLEKQAAHLDKTAKDKGHSDVNEFAEKDPKGFSDTIADFQKNNPREDAPKIQRLAPTKERAWNGETLQIKTKLSKLETGALGERAVIDYLKDKGYSDARTYDTSRTNAPIDLIEDHELIEVKTGFAGNGDTAQQWRATIGQPGKEETAMLKKMSSEEKKKHNAFKAAEIMRRKTDELAKYSKETGRAANGKTITTIINPDTKTIDIFEFEGFHLRIPWKSDEAKKAYKGSYKY